MLWSFVVTASLGVQKLVIHAGLCGLLPGQILPWMLLCSHLCLVVFGVSKVGMLKLRVPIMYLTCDYTCLDTVSQPVNAPLAQERRW